MAKIAEKIDAPEWRSAGVCNQVLDAPDFYISYANTAMMGSFMSGWEGDGDGVETALVRDGEYLILNGDYREQYGKLLPEGYDACKRFYDQQSAHADSSWSRK